QNSNYLSNYGKENILINCKYKVDNSTAHQAYEEDKNRQKGYLLEIIKLNQDINSLRRGELQVSEIREYFEKIERRKELQRLLQTIPYVDPFFQKFVSNKLTPELIVHQVNPPTSFDIDGSSILQGLFKDETTQIDSNKVVRFNAPETSSDSRWFSFEHKGGSFLCKPSINFVQIPNNLTKKLQGNSDNLPSFPITAAFKAGNTTYFFDNNEPQQYSVSDNLAEKKNTNSRWGLVPNNIAENAIVDAAFNDAEEIYLFSGNQYLIYSNGLDLADSDSPRNLQDNTENFPEWDAIGAVFKGADGKTYFFQKDGNQYVDSDDLTTLKPIKDKWGKIKNSFILNAGFGDDRADINAAFTKGNYTYIINRNQFARYSDNNYDYVDDGYPKTHTFYNLLVDLGCVNNNEEDFPELYVKAAYEKDNSIYFTCDIDGNSSKNYKLNENLEIEEIEPATTPWAAFVYGDAEFKFVEQQLVVTTDNGITENYYPLPNSPTIRAALLGKDDYIYLFSNTEYISFSIFSIMTTPFSGDSIAIDSSIDVDVNEIVSKASDWSNKKKISETWGFIGTRVKREGIVDAALVDGDKTYLFSGDEYLVYDTSSNKNYDYVSEYGKKLSDNDDNLPRWSKLDAAFKGSDGKTYFFENTKKIYVESGDLSNEKSIKDRWGIIENNFTTSGRVDAAYVNDGKVFLTSGNQFVRYTLTLTPDNPIGEFVDSGYPQNFNEPSLSKVDAVFSLDNTVYLIAGANYLTLTENKEPNQLGESKLINENFANIPAEFIGGFDAALNNANQLYLFKENTYIKYEDITDINKPKPFLTADANYEIVRLTTSTAEKLNQKLLGGGVPELLSPTTQEIDEVPSFGDESTPTKIKVNRSKLVPNGLPTSSHLDFNSANGIYYWEIFFHAPFLLAQSLNTAQKFEEAKEWYEYIFDPTEVSRYWKFLPFQAVDIPAIIATGNNSLNILESELGTQNISVIRNEFTAIFNYIASLTDVFRNLRKLSDNQETQLKTDFQDTITPSLKRIEDNLPSLTFSAEINKHIKQLQELTGIINDLTYRYDLMKVGEQEINTYLKDPFDPHAIATLRKTAYRKSIVMAYIDNIIDWGDMLFRQYTRESINEARMLYILAYDLLGEKPESLGNIVLSSATTYSSGFNTDPNNYDDFRAELETLPYVGTEPIQTNPSLNNNSASINRSIGKTYFFVPENPLINDYWNRIEDRLRKIRSCQNILGIAQPLPLFEPPIDPNALVSAVASGAGLSSALASVGKVEVPHYRFSFLINKAKELTGKLNSFSGELLAAIEKQDAEELTLMQNKHESIILAMTQSIKEAQLEQAKYSTAALTESSNIAEEQSKHYGSLIKEGLLRTEETQIGLMIAGSTLMTASTIIKAVSAIAWGFPGLMLGPFSTGVKTGADYAGEAVDKTAEALETGGDALSTIGEVLGIYAQHERSVQDWELQKKIADSDMIQIQAQIEGAKQQEIIAEQELEIHLKQIEQMDSINTFMKGKFTNKQLYQWMVSKLSAMYYQTYQMAYEMSKAAEKAFQFERGLPEADVNYITSMYWDSQKKGLLAGQSLELDLDRMEKAYYENHRRGFEITKKVSLIKHDPIALFELKRRGVCTFNLNEADFDYDYPGHYNRQIKTVSITFTAREGDLVNATLTQLTHKTVLKPDLKAVKFLMEPKDEPPLSIRSGWKANQQVAFSHTNTFTGDSQGLFEINFNDERYLPFEGTGAISTWKLELKGKRGSYSIEELTDITINIQYTAKQGGTDFANGVKGMLKPYPASRYFNIANEFPNEWNEFLGSDGNDLILNLTRDLFPNLSGSKITGIFTKFDLYEPGEISAILNGFDNLELKESKFLPTTGLSIASQGSQWILTVKGDKTNLRNIDLVAIYQATVN
ncbi:MAG: hemopexin repeat-containing protein, partial [Cyanobacteria bacterium J06633_8]